LWTSATPTLSAMGAKYARIRRASWFREVYIIMGYAVEMFFDERTENKIRGYFKLLSELGLSKTIYDIGTRPHISLAVYSEVDLNQLSKKLKEFLKNKEYLHLYFVGISVFPTEPSTVYLAPNFSDELRELHNEYHDFMN
jgi:hypothetical protein